MKREKTEGLEAILRRVETGAELSRERVHRQLLRNLENETSNTQKEVIPMKKINRKLFTAAAAACLVLTLSTAAYATEFVQTILARFNVGGMTIEQVDQYNDPTPKTVQDDTAASISPPDVPRFDTLEAAENEAGMEYQVPDTIPGYAPLSYAVHHGSVGSLLEVQYTNESAADRIYSLLISKGENGIQTTNVVREESISGVAVYYANGIVLWEHDGFTYELYQMGGEDFDAVIIGTLIESLK